MDGGVVSNLPPLFYGGWTPERLSPAGAEGRRHSVIRFRPCPPILLTVEQTRELLRGAVALQLPSREIRQPADLE